MNAFAGRWFTTFGPMELSQDGPAIHGTYGNPGASCTITGEMKDGRFVFRFEEPGETGEGWFESSSAGQFRGQYRPDGVEQWLPWNGQREWDGIWDTSFGRMRLIQDAEGVHGIYDGGVPGSIEGRLDGSHFTFRYAEPTVQGEGSFELCEDWQTFNGRWHPDGATDWGGWQGRRVHAQTGLTWLVVIEAHWQHSLADRDYSYGNMLKEIFARLPHVAVRQRFFNDEVSLERWCRELVYFPEPAIVLIASHGTPGAVTVHGQTIDTQRVLNGLRHASNIQLLHFSACLVMKEEKAGDFGRRVEKDIAFPISGYTTSVDWGASAILEFQYLDMILGKRCTPEQAAELLPRVITYAGDESPEGSPYVAVGFRFFKPGSVQAAKPILASRLA